jgi:hypothetical protein
MIKTTAHIGPDGIIRLEVPTDMPPGEVEIVLVVETTPEGVDENGWPDGFFERTYGALADDPIERPPQPPLETRDILE